MTSEALHTEQPLLHVFCLHSVGTWHPWLHWLVWFFRHGLTMLPKSVLNVWTEVILLSPASLQVLGQQEHTITPGLWFFFHVTALTRENGTKWPIVGFLFFFFSSGLPRQPEQVLSFSLLRPRALTAALASPGSYSWIQNPTQPPHQPQWHLNELPRHLGCAYIQLDAT